MRITKVMLEAQVDALNKSMIYLRSENDTLNKEVKLLKGVIDTYSRMPSLIIATERISDALAQTVDKVFRIGQR